MLSTENGCGRLKNLEQKLRMRQQYMIAQVDQIYPVRPLYVQSPDHKLGFTSNIIKTSMLFSTFQFPWVFSPLLTLATKLYGHISDN